MSKTFVVLLLLGLLSVSWAYSIAKVRVAAPEGWSRVRRASPNQVLKFRFALKQSNLDVLDAMLMDISNPDSPNYAKWMTKDRVLDLVAPALEDTMAVGKWLIASGAQNVDWSGRDVVKAEATVATIEAMFGVQMHEFRHTSGKQLTRHLGSLAVPAHLAHVVDFVSGLTELWEPSHNKVHTSKNSKRNDVSEGYVIPEYIRKLYGIPKSWTPSSKSSICVAEFQDDQSYSSDDNTYFNQQMGENVQVSKNVGPFDPSQPDGESTLDVQYAFSIGSNVTSWFWTVDGWMYEFATDLFNTPNPPLVVSMSWGWPEPRQCEIATCSDSQQYVQRTNAEFLKITSTGVTLLASSGDQGAPGDTNPNCDNSDTPLSNIFPGGSPYVTSVGATMINPNGNPQNPPPSYSSPVCQSWQCPAIFSEVPCTYPGALITTGGGFSSYVARPSWQNDAVSAYLKSGVTLPPASTFNSANRAFPDVSALGHAYLIAITGSLEQVDGTSCSSPVMGGIVSMLNSWRFNNGKKALGFINPLLYKAWATNKAIFNDQTTGNNYCTESCCATYGFNAAKGWDPVTGLGTPNWAPLLAFVQSLPN